ncbi:MAG: ferritin-like domain-containing protein [Nocardioides sp.]
MTPLQTLQQTLAGEHAAVYIYGALGGRVSASREPALAAAVGQAYAVHRARRDQLVTMVRTAGGQPVAPEVAYALPTPCRTTAQLREAARITEQRCAEVYAAMVGGTSQANRQWAIDALVDAAVREVVSGAAPEPFPGVAEL